MTSLLADFDGDVQMFVAILLFAVFTTTLVFGIEAWSRRRASRAADSWDQIQGKVEHTDVYVEDRGKIDVHVAQVSYSYRVDGEYFAGEFTKDFLREKKAYEFIDSIDPGTEVVVRCDPNDPQLSVLREEDNSALQVRKPSPTRI